MGANGKSATVGVQGPGSTAANFVLDQRVIRPLETVMCDQNTNVWRKLAGWGVFFFSVSKGRWMNAQIEILHPMFAFPS